MEIRSSMLVTSRKSPEMRYAHFLVVVIGLCVFLFFVHFSFVCSLFHGSLVLFLFPT